SALNARPSRLVSADGAARPAARVVGWGTWARFFQANVAFAAEASAKGLEHSLGLPEDAQKLQGGLDKALSDLDVWPAVDLTLESARTAALVAQWRRQPPTPRPPGSVPAPAADEARREACARGVKLIQEAPELVPPHVWVALDHACAEQHQKQ